MPIKLAENFRAVFYAPFYATHALGFHAREGVEVELVSSPAPAAAQSSLFDGSLDVSWGGPMRVMKARDEDRNSPLLCFCEVAGRDPFFLVGRSDRMPFRLADLPRLRLATVSEVPTPWLCLQHDLREHGIDPSKLNRVADRSMADNLAALCGGDLDVVQLFEPFVSKALIAGAGEILYTASARGPTVYTTYLATRDSIARNHQAFAAMRRATARMQTWLAERGADELAAVTAPFYPDVAPDILARSLRRYLDAGLWSTSTQVSREGFDRLADSLRSGGFISHQPRYEDCVDESLS
jgi:NitT/TauT family transport system substrate-binding protein